MHYKDFNFKMSDVNISSYTVSLYAKTAIRKRKISNFSIEFQLRFVNVEELNYRPNYNNNRVASRADAGMVRKKL